MDLRTFISHVTASLAWPVTVAFLALVFRKEVAALAARVTNIKARGVSVKLRDQLKEVERGVPSSPVREVAPTLREISPPGHHGQIQKEVREKWHLQESPLAPAAPPLSPGDQIATTWKTLRRTLVQKARGAGGTNVRGIDDALAYLAADEDFDPFEESFNRVRLAYRKLKRQDLDAATAADFVKACHRLLEYLNGREW